jgi:hypothetical protein
MGNHQRGPAFAQLEAENLWLWEDRDVNGSIASGRANSQAAIVRVDVSIVLSLLSLKLGRSIRFDPVKETIVGDREAARLAVPKYRAPWKFPAQYLKA